MPWFKVDDGLHSHPKAVEAGLEAMGLWVLLGSHCGFYVGQRGRVARASAVRIAGSARTLARCADRLVKAGFWEVDGDGWVFHDWDVYQPTPESIEAEYIRKSNAGKAGAAARAGARAAAGARPAEHDPSTATPRSEHETSTTRARDEHDASTTTTQKKHDVSTTRARREHETSTDATRPDELTPRNNSLRPQQLLNGCSSDTSAACPAEGQPARASRPVPSRPVPERSEIPPTPPGGLGSIVVGPERPRRVVDMGTPRCQAACEAFVAALADRGWTRGEVREPWERRALCDAINAHLRADGSAEGVLSELRRAVGEWAQAFEGRQRFTSGWGARKFADWLAEGREPAPGTRGTVAAAPPVTSSEPEVYYPPPTPEEAAELERALANLGNPPPEAKSGARAAVGEDHTPAERAALEAKRQAAIALLRAEAVADAREAS